MKFELTVEFLHVKIYSGLSCPLLPYGYSYKSYCARPG